MSHSKRPCLSETSIEKQDVIQPRESMNKEHHQESKVVEVEAVEQNEEFEGIDSKGK